MISDYKTLLENVDRFSSVTVNRICRRADLVTISHRAFFRLEPSSLQSASFLPSLEETRVPPPPPPHVFEVLLIRNALF